MYNERAKYYKRYLQGLKSKQEALEVQFNTASAKREELVAQQDLIERTRVALEQARPLLSASSIKQLEALANTALSTIFDIQGIVEFDVESSRFVIKDDNKIVDLADSCGGGIVTAISFIFDLYLLVKSGCRKLLIYDEAFTAVSDAFYENFIMFMRQACHDLGVDLLCVSHDTRFTIDMADTAYRIENGKSIKVK